MIQDTMRKSAKTSKCRIAGAIGLMLSAHVAVGAGPSADRALEKLGRGDAAGARADYEALLQASPGDARLAFNSALAAYRSGDWDGAARRYESALSTEDLRLQQKAFFGAGNARFRQGEAATEPAERLRLWEEAIRQYQAALGLNPADTDARANLEMAKESLAQEQKEQDRQKKESGQDQKEKDKGKEKDDKQEKGKDPQQGGEGQKDPAGKDQDQQGQKQEGKDSGNGKDASSPDKEGDQGKQQERQSGMGDPNGRNDKQEPGQSGKDPSSNSKEPGKDGKDGKDGKQKEPGKQGQQGSGNQGQPGDRDGEEAGEGSQGGRGGKPAGTGTAGTAGDAGEDSADGRMAIRFAERMLDAHKREEKALILRPASPTESRGNTTRRKTW